MLRSSSAIAVMAGLLLAAGFAGAQARTTISDTLYFADGTTPTGRLNIAWPQMKSADGYTIAAGSTNLAVTNGVVSIALVPNEGATPAGTVYTVRYFLPSAPPGSRELLEYWTVPAAGPTTVRAIRSYALPVPTVIFAEHQITLGTGLADLLGFWRRGSDPTATAEGQCYWRTGVGLYCSDASLVFSQISGGGGGGGAPGGSTNAAQYKSGASSFGGVALNASATPMYLRQVSSAAPTFAQPSITDVSEGTSGSGAAARVSSPVITGSPTASASTVELGTAGAPFGGLHLSRQTSGKLERLVLDATNTGISRTSYYPTVGGDSAERTAQRGFYYAGVVDQPADTTHLMAPGFSSYSADYHSLFTYAGDGVQGQSAKSTWAVQRLLGRFDAAGQKFGTSANYECSSSSDCFGAYWYATTRGGVNQGDEGAGALAMWLKQDSAAQTGSITAVGAASTCNTTITDGDLVTPGAQGVTRSINAQSVAVASVSGCNVGDWVIVAQQIEDTGDGLEDAMQILAVDGGAGTINGVFRRSVSVGALVKPGVVVTLSNRVYVGEGRYLVLTNGASYTTGTTTGFSSRAITGSGTTWATNMVGGDSTQIGCFSSDGDRFNSALRSWFPIQSVDSATQITIAYRLTAGTVAYPGAASGTYVIRPCARIMRIIGTGSQVVLDANPFSWSGATYEAAISPEADFTGVMLRLSGYTVSGGYRSGLTIRNQGGRKFTTGIGVDAAMEAGGDTRAWGNAFSSTATVSGAHYAASGRADTSGMSLAAPLDSSDRQARYKSGGSYFGEHHDGTAIFAVLEQNNGVNRLTFGNNGATIPANATAPLGIAQLDTRNFVLKGDSAQSAWLTFDTTRQGGSGIWSFRSNATSLAQPTAGNGGVDFHSNALSRVTLGLTDFGYVAMNSRAAATGVAGTSSYSVGWTYETWEDAPTFAATRRMLFAAAVPTSGSYIAASDPQVEWGVRQAIHTGTGSDSPSVANLFFGVNTNGTLRWRAVATGAGGYAFYAALLSTSLTASRNYTMPDATGTIALTSSNVATATALAANGANCTNQFPRGMDASGAAESCASVAGTDFATQAANVVFAGPTSGGSASPTFRSLVGADLPAPGASSLGGVRSLTCGGTDKLSAIGTDGIPVCSADQTGGGSSHTLLSATHTDTLAGTVVRGDIVVANSTPAWARLAIGANLRVLASDGTDAAWTALTKSHLPAATVFNDQANTWSTGAQDFGAATSLKVPASAGAAPTASGLVAYDTTANVFKAGANGSGKTFPFTSDNLSVFAATTSAQLAGVLSDETGSGKAVFATNPLLTSWWDVTKISAPANPASTELRVFANTTTGKLACLDSAGADCMPSGSGAPTGAQYLALATDSGLSAERVFTPRYNLAATDAGANGNYTVDFDPMDVRVAYWRDDFACNTNGTNSVGQLGWRVVGTVAACLGSQTIPSAPVYRFDTGSTSARNANLNLDGAAANGWGSGFDSTAGWAFRWRIRTNSSTNVRYFCGLSSVNQVANTVDPDAVQNGMWVKYDAAGGDTDWEFRTRNGATCPGANCTETAFTDSGFDPDTSSWWTIELASATGGTVTARISKDNGATWTATASHTTNLSTSVLSPVCYVYTSEAASKTLDVTSFRARMVR